MKVGDLVELEESLYKSMRSVGVKLNRVAIITKEKDGFYCVSTGEVDDMWLTLPDIRKVKITQETKKRVKLK
tara:strand:- start:536 stop:751 length:216 start_codon:yes stop_codon:yes gene_type:complete